ncbi:hypothetical protein [Pseudoalteromonas nigrifaciens]|uniref:hypothetical protein n=1 Tax=Pseudoalteromonas nigrifaciens TaxID=28109 RepID=UPI003D07E919
MISKDFLDEERKKLWKEVVSLKDEIASLREDVNKATPDYEAEAKQSSKKASEYRNRSMEAKESADSALASTLSVKQSIEDFHSDLSTKKEEVQSALTVCGEATENVEEFYKKIVKLDDLLLKYDEYSSQVEEIKSYHDKGEETSTKINLLYSTISKKKKEVDEVYVNIFGYEEEDEETGEVKPVAGLKEDLEKAYSDLSSSIEQAHVALNTLEETTSEKNDKFLIAQEEKVVEKIGKWESEHAATSKKVKDLLPDALTAGLSHAFSEKRTSEIESGEKLNKVFNWSIFGLVLVSLVPFAVNAYLLNHGKGLEDVIRDLPRLLTSIIPLYIPLVWLAYSSNKKANLSKRLVEEYTHKEVLSKTFEGLSSQIESIEEDSISAELRIKLLYNLLDVSAENPGKLISNYDTSDHPLIDALEASSKLGESVKKLDKIPGLAKISGLLDKRAKRLIKEQTDNITDALESVDG